MSKGLKALSKIAKRIGTLKVDENGEMYNSLEDMYEPYQTIEKELKALEIIKKKNVSLVLVKVSKDEAEYNYNLYHDCELNEYEKEKLNGEFKLLKEVLWNEWWFKKTKRFKRNHSSENGNKFFIRNPS